MSDTDTRATGLGVHVADLPTTGLPPGAEDRFHFLLAGGRPVGGADFAVAVGPDDSEPTRTS